MIPSFSSPAAPLQSQGRDPSPTNILNNGAQVGAGQNLTAEDRVYIPVPLYHCFGMVMGILGVLTHGAQGGTAERRL